MEHDSEGENPDKSMVIDKIGDRIEKRKPFMYNYWDLACYFLCCVPC